MATSLSIWRCLPSDVRSRVGMRSRALSLPGEGRFGASGGKSSEKARLVVGRAKKRPVVVDRWTRPSTPTAPDASEGPPKWDEFAAHVSGSWNGHNAEFNMFGEPLNHESVHECTTLAHPEIGRLSYKLIANATSAEEYDATQIAYHSRGSYTSVRRGEEVEVEQCLAHEKTRIRVFQKLGSRRQILVFRESLGGGVPAFADDAKLKAEDVLGKWNSEVYKVKKFHPQEGYTSSELAPSGTEVVQRTPMNTFLYGWLPKDMWTLLLKTGSGGTTIETGWLVDPDLMVVTKCEVGSSGDLKDVSLRVEKRISSEVPSLKVSAEDLVDLLSE